jgi:hypothetical protein
MMMRSGVRRRGARTRTKEGVVRWKQFDYAHLPVLRLCHFLYGAIHLALRPISKQDKPPYLELPLRPPSSLLLDLLRRDLKAHSQSRSSTVP